MHNFFLKEEKNGFLIRKMSFSIILSGTEKVKICHKTSRGGWKSDGGSPLHRLQISASFFGCHFPWHKTYYSEYSELSENLKRKKIKEWMKPWRWAIASSFFFFFNQSSLLEYFAFAFSLSFSLCLLKFPSTFTLFYSYISQSLRERERESWIWV